jgi:hypothetical protein
MAAPRAANNHNWPKRGNAMVRIFTVAGAMAVLCIGVTCPAAFADSTYDTALRASYCLGFLEANTAQMEVLMSGAPPAVQRELAPVLQKRINLRSRAFSYLLATGFLNTMPSLMAQRQGQDDFMAAMVTHTMSIAEVASRSKPCFSLSFLPY